MRVLSLFSGCGGLDLGFEGGFDVLKEAVNFNINSDWSTSPSSSGLLRLQKTGFNTVFANDISLASERTWKFHFENYGGSYTKRMFKRQSIVDWVKNIKRGRDEAPQDIDVITGGFPCQDFSVAGKRRGFQSNKLHNQKLDNHYKHPTEENRGMLYWWMREMIELVKPKMFVAENVRGLISLNKAKEIIESDFKDIGDGYIVIPSRVLKAYEYGVPQSRERVFFIGFDKSRLSEDALRKLQSDRIDEDYNPYPSPTHYLLENDNSFEHNSGLMPHVKLRDALRNLQEPHLSQDLSQQNYSKAKWMGRHCQGQTEIKLDTISPTIRAEHHGNIEFRRLAKKHGGKIEVELGIGMAERRLTVRECARIQTFPDDFIFVKKSMQKGESTSTTEAYKLIGNAVPPLLGFHVAMKIRKNWNKYFKG